jgi:hypothetical protein
MSERLLRLLDGLTVLRVLSDCDSLAIVSTPRLITAAYLVCRRTSRRRHRVYERIPADLP